MLTIAVARGRIWESVLPLLSRLNAAPAAADIQSRKLLIPTPNPDVQLVIVRALDAPTFVASGAAQAGIVGRDVLAEYNSGDILLPQDLNIARCRLAVAAREDFDYAAARQNGAPIVAATKYVNLARAHFAARGVSANFIKFNGAVELAAVLGLSDVIVDLVDSGDTLRDNRLVEVEKVLEVSAMFITNQTAASRHRKLLKNIQQKLARQDD